MAAINRPSALTSAEWSELSNEFSLSTGDVGCSLVHSAPVEQLLQPDVCRRYIDWLGQYIGSPSRRVTASMLAKRYAHVAVSPELFAMTMYNQRLGVSPADCVLLSPDDEQRSRFPDLHMTRMNVCEPVAGKRGEWRDHILRDLFADHVAPLFRQLARIGGVPAAILWENAAVRVAPMYAGCWADSSDEEKRERVRDDLVYIVHNAAADLFGERRNPFAAFVDVTIADNPAQAAGRVRRTCCMYYEMAPEYCRKCPKTNCG